MSTELKISAFREVTREGIEKALKCKLYDHVWDYICSDSAQYPDFKDRQTGKTLAFCIKNALYTGRPLDIEMWDVEEEKYNLRTLEIFKQKFIDIHHKLTAYGFKTRGIRFNQKYMNNVIEGMKDNGTRIVYESGGLRENNANKGCFNLIGDIGTMRLARWYELGTHKYPKRNWEKGLSVDDCLNSIHRHYTKYKIGFKDEDHMAAIAWNAFAIMHMEILKPELVDLYTRHMTPEEDLILELRKMYEEGTGVKVKMPQQVETESIDNEESSK